MPVSRTRLDEFASDMRTLLNSTNIQNLGVMKAAMRHQLDELVRIQKMAAAGELPYGIAYRPFDSDVANWVQDFGSFSTLDEARTWIQERPMAQGGAYLAIDVKAFLDKRVNDQGKEFERQAGMCIRCNGSFR